MAVLAIVGFALLMPWGKTASSAQADAQLLPLDESIWLSARDAEESGPLPAGATHASALPEATTVPPTPTTRPDYATPTLPTMAATAATVPPPSPMPTASPVPTRAGPPAPRSYQVQAGDNVARIAARFGVSQETILWGNALANPNALFVGQTLSVLPIEGLAHQVRPGESLSSVADLYGVSAASIAEYNELSSADVLQVGQTLLVPGGKPPTPQPTASSTPPPTATSTSVPTRLPPTITPAPRNPTAAGPLPTRTASPRPSPTPAPATPAAAPKPEGRLAWPVGGSISQQFGEQGHQGIDIAAGMGAPVRSAADGKVANLQKRQYGYGWFVVIDHGGGLKTLYAHLSGFNVQMGDAVKRGQQIGSVGSTGLSTGPHLHFEVTQNDHLVNPLSLL